MNVTDTNAQFDAAMASCRDIFSRKLDDYGASWRIMRPESITDQIFIKAKRIRSLETKGISKVGEGILPELYGDSQLRHCRADTASARLR